MLVCDTYQCFHCIQSNYFQWIHCSSMLYADTSIIRFTLHHKTRKRSIWQTSWMDVILIRYDHILGIYTYVWLYWYRYRFLVVYFVTNINTMGTLLLVLSVITNVSTIEEHMGSHIRNSKYLLFTFFSNTGVINTCEK